MRQIETSPKEQATRTLTNQDQLAALSPEALSEVLKLALADVSGATADKILQVLNKALGSTSEARKEVLLKEHKVEVVGDSQIHVALNGISRIEIIRAINEVASEIHGRPAINGPLLDRWAKDPAFTAIPLPDKVIGVDGNVKDSTNKSRTEQAARGWNNVDLCDLALAHTAYFLATGKDLFDGNVVRARDGALSFFEEGLHVHGYGDAYRSNCYVGASSALPSRN